MKQTNWLKYRDVNFWRDVSIKSRQTFGKHKRRLRKLNRLESENIQQTIAELMCQKVNKLEEVTNCNFSGGIKTCLITGIDISMQKKESFLSSHSGLENLSL